MVAGAPVFGVAVPVAGDSGTAGAAALGTDDGGAVTGAVCPPNVSSSTDFGARVLVDMI